MSFLLLDTNVISDLFRAHPDVVRQFKVHIPQDLHISSVTVMEIEYGMERQPSARSRFGEVWAALQHDLTVVPFGTEDAGHTALIRAHLSRAGTPIGPSDLQLAGTALARRLRMVTHDTAEFKRVPGLICEDWRTD